MSPAHIWIFDENRRVYAKRDGLSGGPIWREHWVKHSVVGETTRSWILSNGRKIAKSQKPTSKIAFSESQIDDLEWAKVHMWKIRDRVERASPDELKQIAAIVGFSWEATR
jgi:hypothetical protein